MKLPVALLFSLSSLSGASSAAEPCGSLELNDGAVKTGLTLSSSSSSLEADACLRRIGAELQARGGLRSVTVTVRTGDAARADGSGDVVVKATIDKLVAAGLPRARVSGVVASGEGDVRISFAERAGVASVGRIGALGGEVRVGASVAAAAVAAAGAPLPPESFVITGATGNALLELADRSQLRLHNNTVVHLKRLQLNDKLQRVVQLEVPQGAVDVVVAKGGEGSRFDIQTPWATAGVRGTVFRIVAAESPGEQSGSSSATRLETLEGAVELTGTKGSASSARVERGFGSRVDDKGTPSAPRPLPKAPVPTGPLKGESALSLAWAAVDGAVGYRVELARDAELLIDATTSESKTTTTTTTTLAAGDWYWRVSAVGPEGFVGASSQTFKFNVRH
ncbi:MAG: FecR family protein [Deltaproteobacteria bacterium]|nr:FecR family protein [Deltaproteobacteria bacterium]